MKLCHSIKIKVFCQANEDEKQITNALKTLFPFDLEENKITIKKSTAPETKRYTEMKILSIKAEKEKLCKLVLNNIMEKLSQEQKDLLIKQLNSRVDDNADFYIRIDKTKYINKKEFWITDSGNCFHIRIAIAAYPAKKEKAIVIAKNIIQQKA